MAFDHFRNRCSKICSRSAVSRETPKAFRRLSRLVMIESTRQFPRCIVTTQGNKQQREGGRSCHRAGPAWARFWGLRAFSFCLSSLTNRAGRRSRNRPECRAVPRVGYRRCRQPGDRHRQHRWLRSQVPGRPVSACRPGQARWLPSAPDRDPVGEQLIGAAALPIPFSCTPCRAASLGVTDSA